MRQFIREHAAMNILIVTSSAQGAASVSTGLARGFAEQVEAAHPGSRITWRDVGHQPLPHLAEETIAGIRADAQSEAEIAARDISDELIAEVRGADLVVIASPGLQFRDQLHAEDLVRLSAAAARLLPLHGEGAGRAARRPQGRGDRKPGRRL
jgi:hypothetical protein